MDTASPASSAASVVSDTSARSTSTKYVPVVYMICRPSGLMRGFSTGLNSGSSMAMPRVTPAAISVRNSWPLMVNATRLRPHRPNSRRYRNHLHAHVRGAPFPQPAHPRRRRQQQRTRIGKQNLVGIAIAADHAHPQGGDGVLRTVRTQEQRTRTVADRAGGTWRAAGESQGTGLQPRKLINRIIHTFQSTDHHAPLAANTPDTTPFT